MDHPEYPGYRRTGKVGRNRHSMDLMDKLAKLAQRYEELNTLMAEPEVVQDSQALQRYGREHAELEEIVQKYHELTSTERQLAEAQELYESGDAEMRELAAEEIETLKERREELLNEVRILLLPKDIVDRSEERRVGKECRSRWSP